MALPVLVVFGVTVETLADRHYPTGITTERQKTKAAEAIEAAAVQVNVRLRAAKIEPEEIKEAQSPLGYRWLQDLVLTGSAVKFSGVASGGGGDDLSRLQKEWDDGLRMLETARHMVIGDVQPQASDGSGGSRGVFNPV